MDSTLILLHKSARKFYGSTVKLLSPAKINLYLNILGKYPSGYHRLQSIFERISLFDQLEIKVIKENRVKISCNEPSLSGPKNICFKAAQLVKQKIGVDAGFAISLKKNIPVGSGLGSASSNAASVIIGIARLLKINLSAAALFAFGKALGSDVNFFLSQKKFALVEGRGEKVTPFASGKLHHLIIWPGERLSTKDVYRRYDANPEKLTKFFSDVNIMRSAVKNRDFQLIKNYSFNSLERSALFLSAKLRKAKCFFDKQGIFSRVTGSGSALFTLEDSGVTYNRIRKILPPWCKVFKVNTF